MNDDITDSEAIEELRRFLRMCPDPRISTPRRVVDEVRGKVEDLELHVEDLGNDLSRR